MSDEREVWREGCDGRTLKKRIEALEGDLFFCIKKLHRIERILDELGQPTWAFIPGGEAE